jgi:hypothetical protein
MKKVTVNGIECLLFEGSEKVAENPGYAHKCGIRHHSDDWDMPVTIEEYVCCNRFGSVLAKEPMPMMGGIAQIVSYIDEDGRERISINNEG